MPKARGGDKTGYAPSFQFYPDDWISDPALRRVNLAARGLWLEILCEMWKNSANRGRSRDVIFSCLLYTSDAADE